MIYLNKRFSIRVPKNISLLYSEKNKNITLIGPIKKQSLILKVKILITNKANSITITRNSFEKSSNHEKKRLSEHQGAISCLLKQIIFNISHITHKKLKLIGVGYKIFLLKKFYTNLLLFKLGYSHNLYVKLPPKLDVVCLRANSEAILSGDSYQNVSQMSSIIRLYKKPDPYKGKGISYENEQIHLKEGKKLQ